MAVKYTSGTVNLRDKDAQTDLGEIRYQMMETGRTKYTTGKWWGDFSTKKEVRRLGNYLLEFEDGRKGEAIISINYDAPSKTARYQYTFFGRGALGRSMSTWRR